MLVNEHDFTVQFCPNVDPCLTPWCVSHDGAAVFFDRTLDGAILWARRMARDTGQSAWLLSSGLTIKIPPPEEAIPATVALTRPARLALSARVAPQHKLWCQHDDHRRSATVAGDFGQDPNLKPRPIPTVQW